MRGRERGSCLCEREADIRVVDGSLDQCADESQSEEL